MSNYFKDRRCNLCGFQKFKKIYSSESYPDGRKGCIIKCQRCGLICRNTDIEYHTFTNPNFKSHRRPDYPDKILSGTLNMYKEYIHKLSNFRKYNRVLDVGTGQGFFLKLCAENKWEIFGIELNPELSDFAKNELGIHVIQGTFEETKYYDNFFDVATFFNVLEHMAEPDLSLQKAFRLLRKGGCLFIRTPNANLHVSARWLITRIYRFWKKIKNYDDFVVHLYAFNPSTITRYFRKIGFENIEVRNARFRFNENERKNWNTHQKIWSVYEYLINIFYLISHGACLIAPSLSVSAIKPLNYKI